MQVFEAPLKGLLIDELDIYEDNRGYFVERFSKNKFEALSLPVHFVQDNHSRSFPGVIRGLHFQPKPAQGKLVGCPRGSILDVAVDIRTDSPTFGEYFDIELNDSNGKLLWIPPGFAHGFCVLGNEPADVTYKITSHYNPDGETGIAWNDPDINIAWPFEKMAEPITSERDTNQQSLAHYKAHPSVWLEGE